MPPQPKLTRDAAIAAAVELVRASGLESVNARSLAARLDTSTKPLFRLYTGMDELKRHLIDELNVYYNAYMDERMTDDNRLVSQGIAYISFARTEPHIFNALFMNRTMAGSTLQGVSEAEWNRATIENVQAVAGGTDADARAIFLKVWLFSHGIATQIVSCEIDIPDGTVAELVEDAFWRFAQPAPPRKGRTH